MNPDVSIWVDYISYSLEIAAQNLWETMRNIKVLEEPEWPNTVLFALAVVSIKHYLMNMILILGQI